MFTISPEVIFCDDGTVSVCASFGKVYGSAARRGAYKASKAWLNQTFGKNTWACATSGSGYCATMSRDVFDAGAKGQKGWFVVNTGSVM